jgi:CxxC motif-containing protein (DUF1111 family)
VRRPRTGAALGVAAAFVLPVLAGLVAARAGDLDAAIGRSLFHRAWVPAPSSTRANDGLGPLFNARACASCHQDLERAPVAVGPDGQVASDHLVIRISDAAGRPDPVYGHQLQTASVPGEAAPEGGVGRNAAGHFQPVGLAYGPLSGITRAGARVAPQLRGLGHLAAVPDEAIAALANPGDRDGDGVRGRANWIAMPDGVHRVGRFGLKAGAATLDDQVETAFALDLGLSTPGRAMPAGDCTQAQSACLGAPHGGGPDAPEITGELVRRIALYLASIAPPAPANGLAGRRGARLFAEVGCAACHRPALPSPSGPVRAFTDLLLHDLGPELDGGATELGVDSREWRTAPLWGLSRALEKRAGLLHDGRAATVAEAIRLHGGEAAHSRERFEALAETDRDRLLAYVGSL